MFGSIIMSKPSVRSCCWRSNVFLSCRCENIVLFGEAVISGNCSIAHFLVAISSIPTWWIAMVLSLPINQRSFLMRLWHCSYLEATRCQVVARNWHWCRCWCIGVVVHCRLLFELNADCWGTAPLSVRWVAEGNHYHRRSSTICHHFEHPPSELNIHTIICANEKKNASSHIKLLADANTSQAWHPHHFTTLHTFNRKFHYNFHLK